MPPPPTQSLQNEERRQCLWPLEQVRCLVVVDNEPGVQSNAQGKVDAIYENGKTEFLVQQLGNASLWKIE